MKMINCHAQTHARKKKRRKEINSKTHIERSQKQEKKYNFTPLNMVKNQNRETF